ncbi:hypothetical protein M408DRAFT_24632 [Serendipita vermifera MAFF 305830]|uniref:ParB/Sulfiredoxin domain-containing protein n=1 Tax=Serendipita vermifera MAFF 305830 TaxID=933852 RepID=A0A0C3AS77_SERVB|nr:hypothetical protein M408DRAFT_24632 [Serendipita vermifera MAFF 305830]
MASSIIHQRVHQARFGVAMIPLDSIVFDNRVREEDATHSEMLKKEIDSITARWMDPVHLVASVGIDNGWLSRLITEKLVEMRPTGGEFVCISGRHRIAAANKLREDHPELDCYPAIIYDKALLCDPELNLWIESQNLDRLVMKGTLYRRLAVADTIQEEAKFQKTFILLGWNEKQASCLVSLRRSEVWQPLLSLANERFYAAIPPDTIYGWSKNSMAYPFISLIIKDLLDQQVILKDFSPKLTMEYLFGPTWASNNRISKTGTRENMANRMLNTKSERYMPATFARKWEKTKRSSGDYLFGDMVPTIYDLDIHRKPTPLSDKIYRAEQVASYLHLYTHYPDLKHVPGRRNPSPQNEATWAQLIGDSTPKELFKLILEQVDSLIPPKEEECHALISVNPLPHVRVLENLSELAEVLRPTRSKGWELFLSRVQTLGLVFSDHQDLSRLPSDPPSTQPAVSSSTNSANGERAASRQASLRQPRTAQSAPMAARNPQNHRNTVVSLQSKSRKRHSSDTPRPQQVPESDTGDEHTGGGEDDVGQDQVDEALVRTDQVAASDGQIVRVPSDNLGGGLFVWNPQFETASLHPVQRKLIKFFEDLVAVGNDNVDEILEACGISMDHVDQWLSVVSKSLNPSEH